MMDTSLVDGLLRAFGLMVLERWPDGSLVAVSSPPAWFPSVSRDGTFPFLGGFLDEAAAFWDKGEGGRVGSGLCEAVDGDGRAFHFEAWALNTVGRHFLVFERSDAAEQLRGALQGAREEKLAKAASDKAARDAAERLHALAREVRVSVEAIRNLVSASTEFPSGVGQVGVLDAVRVAAVNLGARAEALAGK